MGNNIKGDSHIQNNGDGDIISSSFNNSPTTIINNWNLVENELSRTLIFDCLQIFNDSPIEANASYSLIDPAGLFEKLEKNYALKYKEYALVYSEDFNKIGEVIRDFNDSSSIVKKLIKVFVDGFDNENNGDENLKVLEKRVIKIIKSDERYEMQYDEKLEEFVISFILYGIYKCKILRNPNET